MNDPLKNFLKEVRDAFFVEDYDALSRHCALPLVVYSAAGVVAIKDHDEIKLFADRYHQILSAFPITRSECRIVQRDPAVNQRMRVTARWDEFGEDNTPLTSSLVRYFLYEKEPNVWLIEMLEYLEMAVSMEDAERIIH
ncbi:MAG: hypothetical protein HKN27_07180 [Silicimonas sp.]|nr:hypothetical protein [Silicimonas sp.]